MKTRHVVTLIVVVVAGALLAGILLRLQGTDEENGGTGEMSTAEDSVAEEVRSTAASSAFATEVAVSVGGARARRDTFVIWAQGEGQAAPLRRAELQAQVGGPVVEVPVDEGAYVREGALLVRIDSTEQALAVEEARAGLEEARANYESRVLFDDQIEDDSLRQARREQARIRAGLPAAEVELRRARLDLEKTLVRAPFAGRVADLAVRPGMRVSEGDSLATVLDLSRLEVDVQVLETQLPSLEVGREAVVTFPAFPGEEFTGRVASMNPSVDDESDQGRVTVRLRNPEARLLPGMHAEVRIAGRLHEDRVFVPREAVVERDRRDVVFVFEPGEEGTDAGRAQWRYVNLGLENDRYVEIAEPAEDAQATPSEIAGSVVLVRGHATLTHDARVRLTNADSLVPGDGE